MEAVERRRGGGAYLRQGQLKGEDLPLRRSSGSWLQGSAEWRAAAALWGEGHTLILWREGDRGGVRSGDEYLCRDLKEFFVIPLLAG